MKKIRDIKGVYSADKVGYTKNPKYATTSTSNEEKEFFPITDEALEYKQRAANCYNAMSNIRERRKRSRRYYRGQQWLDKITVHKDGRDVVMTEEEYIQSQGKPALKQNLIRPPIRNIISQHRSYPFKSVIYSRNRNDKLAAEMMSVAYESAYEMNDGRERDSRMMEEFLVSGFPIYETSYSWDIQRQRPIPKFRKVEVNRFFVTPNVNDVCGDDVDFVGELMDMPLDAAISAYAKDEEQEKELRKIFGNRKVMNSEREAFSSDNVDRLSFDMPISNDIVRIIKIWALEGHWTLDVHDYADGTRSLHPLSKSADFGVENAEREALSQLTGVEIPSIKVRKKYVREWVCYHITPDGHVLYKKRNPYEHKCHPYIFLMYPMLDGEVWGLVEDLIDQQRAINRMTILQDFVISASAKGVLLVPEECITDDFDLEDIADEWTRFNGVIKIKTKNSAAIPQQIASNNFNVDIGGQIERQMKWLQDIGGVQDAQMGVRGTSGTSAARYKQEVASSSLNALDYIDSFGHFLIKRDFKIIQLIKQFYTDSEYIALAGNDYSDEAHNYNPELIKTIDFNNTIGKTDDNITMRFISEDSLAKLLEMGLINLKQYLTVSETMYSEKLLKMVDEAQAAAGNGNLGSQQLAELADAVTAETPKRPSPAGLAQSRGMLNGTII